MRPPSGGAAGDQLAEIMDGAEEAPFVADLFNATQQELPEAARRLDLPEHRLDDLLAQAVGSSASRRA